MSQTVVKASVGRELGSRPSRRLRAQGMLPGVVYGLEKEPQSIAVVYAELRDALNTETGMNTVFQLDVEGATETVLVRAVQRDPIKRVVTHADFLRVDPTQPVTLKVPVNLVGDGTAVTSNGGLIEQKMFEIEIEVSPDSIPSSIDADLGLMTLDTGLSVADLNFPEGVTTRVPDEISVATPIVSRAAKMGDADDLDGAAGEEAGDAEEGGDADGDAE